MRPFLFGVLVACLAVSMASVSVVLIHKHKVDEMRHSRELAKKSRNVIP